MPRCTLGYLAPTSPLSCPSRSDIRIWEDFMNSVQQSARSDRKKHYQAPCLRIYGNLGTLTAALNNTVPNDDGGTIGMNTKTH